MAGLNVYLRLDPLVFCPRLRHTFYARCVSGPGAMRTRVRCGDAALDEQCPFLSSFPAEAPQRAIHAGGVERRLVTLYNPFAGKTPEAAASTQNNAVWEVLIPHFEQLYATYEHHPRMQGACACLGLTAATLCDD